MQSTTIILFFAMVLLISHLQGPVHAYLDPGTGSIMIQAILAAVVGAIAFVKLYWSRLTGLFRRSASKDDELV